MLTWSKNFMSLTRNLTSVVPPHRSRFNIAASSFQCRCSPSYSLIEPCEETQFKRPLSSYGKRYISSSSLFQNFKLDYEDVNHQLIRETQQPISSRRGILLSFCAGVALGAAAKLVYNYWISLRDASVEFVCKEEGSIFPKILAAHGFNKASHIDDSSKNQANEKEDENSSSNKSIFNFNGRGSTKGPAKHRNHFNFIADVVERLSPSVAFIKILDLRRRDAHGKALVVNNGSGVVVDSAGLILTNAHVVTGSNKPRSSKIVVHLEDGRELDCVLEDVDPYCDLALLRVNVTDLTPAPLGNSSELRPGEFVVAVGAPLALSNTVTAGVVSSITRCAKDLGIRANDINYIQTDAAITFGNSGGPLVNLDGDVIGINSMKAAAGISFAIPVDVAKDFLAKAREKMKLKHSSAAESETKRRRFLGITMLSLTPDIITELQTRVAAPLPSTLTNGVLVWRVVIGSPAYHAGLQPGDVITQINGHDITSARDVYHLLERPVDLTMIVHRGNHRYTVTVRPEE